MKVRRGWRADHRRHRVESPLSGLTLASAKEERGRVYRIAEPASL
jgi:hypothetical protein